MWSRRLRTPAPPAPAAGALPGALTAAFALSLLLALPGCQTPGLAPGGNFTEITLTAVGGDQCVAASEDPAVIWSQEVAGRPHQVRWLTESKTPYRWVLDFKGEEGEKDHFGQRVLPCRAPGKSVTSGLPGLVTHSPGDQVEWTYRVILMSCEAGAPIMVCESEDPVVIIRDVQR